MTGSTDAPASAAIGGLPGPAAHPLLAAGLDLLGALDVAAYDARVPTGWRAARLLEAARSVLVVGSGGGRLARAALAHGGADPVDAWTTVAVGRCVASLAADGFEARSGYAFEQRDRLGRPVADGGEFADFVALAEAAGLGVRSRLRLLVHPEYGPWLAVRAVVLTTARLTPTRPRSGFAPCDDCPAPCRDACPGDALAAGPLELDRCAAQRRGAGSPCALHCAARHACVLGRAHAHDTAVEAHFMRSSLRILAARQR